MECLSGLLLVRGVLVRGRVWGGILLLTPKVRVTLALETWPLRRPIAYGAFKVVEGVEDYFL